MPEIEIYTFIKKNNIYIFTKYLSTCVKFLTPQNIVKTQRILCSARNVITHELLSTFILLLFHFHFDGQCSRIFCGIHFYHFILLLI